MAPTYIKGADGIVRKLEMDHGGENASIVLADGEVVVDQADFDAQVQAELDERNERIAAHEGG